MTDPEQETTDIHTTPPVTMAAKEIVTMVPGPMIVVAETNTVPAGTLGPMEDALDLDPVLIAAVLAQRLPESPPASTQQAQEGIALDIFGDSYDNMPLQSMTQSPSPNEKDGLVLGSPLPMAMSEDQLCTVEALNDAAVFQPTSIPDNLLNLETIESENPELDYNEYETDLDADLAQRSQHPSNASTVSPSAESMFN